MACRVIRDKNGNIAEVYAANGNISKLWSDLSNLINDKNKAYDHYLMTRTSEFKDWFGDWESDPNIIDRPLDLNGEPFLEDVNVDNIGNYSKQDDNVYEKIEPSSQHQMSNKLNTKIKRFLDELGIPVETVTKLKDRNGDPMKGIAKADMLNKIIQVVEDKADISTLPEEAAHFFVEIIKKSDPDLYNSMYKMVDKFSAYKKVVEEYGSLEDYQGNETKLKDEAIAKLIANEIVKKHLEDENIQKLKGFKAWFAKLMKRIKNMFGDIFGNPYKTSALQILNNEASQYKDTVAGIQSAETYLQADPKDSTPTESLSEQKKLVKKILNDHNKIYIDPDMLKTDIKGKQYKILRTLMEQDDEGTFARYVIEDENGVPQMITNRITDKSTRDFINKVGLEKAQEVNKSDRAAHARKHGIKFHGAAQFLVEKIASNKKDIFEIEKTHEHGLKTYKEIQAKAELNNKLFKNFKDGVNSIINTIEETQKKINKKNSTEGKATILTEAKLYDSLNDTAGTVDLLVVFSDGTVGIFDWKFMTPPWQYTEGYGEKKNLVDDPFTIKMDGWNTQIGAYKQVLHTVHGIPNTKVRMSRIIPAHVEYKVKDHTKRDFTRTDQAEVFYMGSDQNKFLDQIAVGKELKTEFEGINNILQNLYDKRDKLKIKMQNIKGQKESYSVLKARYLKTLQNIQELTVKEGILNLIFANDERVEQIKENIHKNDPNEDGYLDYNDLLDILEDLEIFSALGKDTVEYIKDLREDPATKNLADRVQGLLADGLQEVQMNIATVRSKMYERLTQEAEGIGENIKETPLKLGWWDKNLSQMDEIPHPVFRVAYNEIVKAFNKSKQVTDSIFEEIESNRAALAKWAEKNKMSLKQAYQKLIEDRIITDEKGNKRVVKRALVDKWNSDLYTKIDEAIKTEDPKFIKKHFKLKKNARETFERWKKNKKVELEVIDNKKQRDSMFSNWERNNNYWVHSSAWLSKENMFVFLELKNPSEWYSKGYQEMLQPGNQPLLKFYEMYRKHNINFAEITGRKQLKPGFIANRQDGIIDTVLNNGFNMNKFFDSMSRPFLMHEEEETHGVMHEGRFISQIPLPYMSSIRNSKGEIDYSLKSADLGKSLYAMALGVYNYKHMSEVEGKVLALKDYLQNHTKEVQTTSFGSIKRDEAGMPKVEDTSKEVVDTYMRYVKYYIYGQKIQDPPKKVMGMDLLKVIPALQSIYSLKVLSFAVVPGIAARAVGGINMYLEGIDGVNYTKKQMKEAHNEYAKNYKAVVTFSEFFDPYQAGLSWKKMRDLSMKKSSKYFNLDNAYYPLRAADENMDTLITISMAKNHGIDKDGNLKRMEDLLMEDENAKSMWDHYLENYKKDKSIVIPGLTDKTFVQFRRRVKEVAGKIKGEMSDENIVAAQTMLMGRLLLQFKSWMPGLLSERFKGRKYNRILDTLEEGRYVGFIKGASFGREMVENDRKFASIVTHTLKRGLNGVAHLAFLKRFVTNPAERARLKKKNKWSKSQEETYQRRVKALTREFEQWKSNSQDSRIKSLTDPTEYLKMRQRSVKRTLAEVRALLMLYAAIMAMGLVGDDDEIKRRSWFNRKMHSILNRTAMELGFTLNPMELSRMLKGSVPLVGLFTDAIKTVTNGFDETTELLGLAKENPYDKTPFGYYGSKWVPGAHQLGRFFEVWGPTSR